MTSRKFSTEALALLNEMNERRKIVIQTGSEADESLSTPHFDAEATLTARPVVPLADGVAGQGYDARRIGKTSNTWLLVLIVLGAVGLGVATGLAIGFYRNRQASAPPVASESTAPAQDSEAGKTVELPTPAPTPPPQEEARASVPEVEEEEEPSVEPKDEKTERAARDEKDDERRQSTPPVVPEKRREADDEVSRENADEEERRAERQRRREERREERRERRRRGRDLELPAEFPRDVERAGREQINRIRDIFEGRQP